MRSIDLAELVEIWLELKGDEQWIVKKICLVSRHVWFCLSITHGSSFAHNFIAFLLTT